MALGIPRIPLGIPDGSNRSVSEVQREMLLADQVAPYQRRVKWFRGGAVRALFGWRANDQAHRQQRTGRR